MNNNQDPKTRPISDNRTIASLFPTRFLKAAQLLAWMVTEIIVTISRMVEEEVSPKPNQIGWKPVLYFKTKDGSEYEKGYLLSAKVDTESLTASTGAQTIQELIGKKIRIKLAEFRGKSVLRIDPDPVPVPTPDPEKPSEPQRGRDTFNEPQRSEPEEPEAFTDSPQGEEQGF